MCIKCNSLQLVLFFPQYTLYELQVGLNYFLKKVWKCFEAKQAQIKIFRKKHFQIVFNME